MGNISVVVSLTGSFKPKTGFVDGSLRSAVQEVECGATNIKIEGGGRWVTADIPETEFEHLCNELGEKYQVRRKADRHLEA